MLKLFPDIQDGRRDDAGQKSLDEHSPPNNDWEGAPEEIAKAIL